MKNKPVQSLLWRIAKPPKFNKVPEKPGIYIISTQQEIDHEYEVKYVGHAENLRKRALEHWSKNESNIRLKDHIAEEYIMKLNYSEVEDLEDREGMVLYIYNYYNPPLNIEAPPERPIVRCMMPAVRKYLE